MDNSKSAYSVLRKSLGLEVSRTSPETLAAFSHFLQLADTAAGECFRAGASSYLNGLQELSPNDIHSIGDLGPVIWDVPFPPVAVPKFTFVDLFAGIGGIRLAYQRLGGKCVFSSEWNTFARQTYEANFGEVPFGDIRSVDIDLIPAHDVLVAGFPCQPFSIAGVTKKNALGKHHGFRDETQGTLFFDIVRIIEAKRPKVFMLENVKNLLTHDNKNTFRVIAGTLDEAGYSVHAKILDGRHFVPQHRERIFIVGFDRNVFHAWENFSFPILPETTAAFQDVLEEEPDAKYTLTDHLWQYLQNYALKHRAKGNGFGYGLTNPKGISRTLSARYYKDGAEILIAQDGKNPRRLTPRECARLQGFPDDFVIPVSDTQAYRQFGNSVVVPLVVAVGAEILKVVTEKADGASGS